MRRECPVCKSQSYLSIKKMRFVLPKYFHLPGGYDVAACNKCGFCYAVTEAALEDYDYYYAHCNFYSGVAEESEGKKELNQKAAKLVSSFLNKDKRLMDIGFGKGSLMRLLRSDGFCNVAGLDPSEESVKIMQTEGFHAYKGSIYDKVREELRGKFDCIFMMDVLEHLLSPGTAIGRMAKYLKEQGYLIVSVPNYAALYNDNSVLIHQFNQEHINYFSPVSLNNLLNQYGFFRTAERDIEKLEQSKETELLLVYQLDRDRKTEDSFIRDTECRKSIMDYVERNEKLEQKIDEKLCSLDNGDRSVYVWGTGAYVMWLLGNTRLGSMNIKAFIDNNPTKIGKELIGKQIISIDKIDEDIPILICVMRYWQEIVNQIVTSGIKNTCLIIK